MGTLIFHFTTISLTLKKPSFLTLQELSQFHKKKNIFMKTSYLSRVERFIYPLAKSAQNTAISCHFERKQMAVFRPKYRHFKERNTFTKYLTSLLWIRKNLTLLATHAAHAAHTCYARGWLVVQHSPQGRPVVGLF